MLKKLVKKLENIVNDIKTGINAEVLSNFLNWFYEKLNIHFKKRLDINLIPKKGDIYLVNLGINIGSELNKTRPCVIFSSSKFNGGSNLIVLLIKSYKNRINKYLNFLVNPDEINNLEESSIVSIVNIREISKKRFIRKIGKLDIVQLAEIDKKLARILGIKKEEL